MPLSDLLPQWIGGTWGGPTSGPFYTPGLADPDVTKKALQTLGGYGPETEAQYVGAGGQSDAALSAAAGAGGASSAGLATALGAVAKAAGGGQSQQSAAAKPATWQPGPAPAAGRPSSPVNIATLLQLLNARRDALMQSATGGVGAGSAPMQQQKSVGLLGY